MIANGAILLFNTMRSVMWKRIVLGLSLSYDIITKGHGGEMKVESKEGKGSKFIITLSTSLA